RASLKESQPDLEAEVERAFQEIMKRGEVKPANAAYVKNTLREQMKVMVIKSNMGRRWKLDLGLRRNFLRDETLFARIKFYAASTNELGTYYLTIRAGAPEAAQRQRIDAT